MGHVRRTSGAGRACEKQIPENSRDLLLANHYRGYAGKWGGQRRFHEIEAVESHAQPALDMFH